MSKQKNLLVRLARDLSERHGVNVETHFTADFHLHDPNAGEWPRGYEGARRMLDATLDFAPDLKMDVVDMVEEGDRVAVRWRVTGTREGKPADASLVAIYRFVDGRIAEDWGLAACALAGIARGEGRVTF